LLPTQPATPCHKGKVERGINNAQESALKRSQKFFASPVLVGNRVYATNEGGETFVLQAKPGSFVELAKNQLCEIFSTPVICNSRIF